MTVECAKCGHIHESSVFFCSACGFDIITGSVRPPKATAQVKSEPVVVKPSSEYMPPSTSPIRVEVTYSKEFFTRVVSEHEVDFPSGDLRPFSLEFVSDELHIGRKDEKRAIKPDIDIAMLTKDFAVSSRHAMLKVSANGLVTLIDLSSTNGTYIGDAMSEKVTPFKEVEVPSGAKIFLGAWTCVEVSL